MSESGNSDRWGLSIGVLSWCLAVALAFAAQHLLGTLPYVQINRAWALYGAAAVVAMAGSVLLERSLPPSPSPNAAQVVTWSRWFSYLRLGLLTASVVASGGVLYLLITQQRYGTAIVLWLASLLAAALAMVDGGSSSRPPLTREQKLEIAAVAALLILAVVLRLPGLEHIPPEVHGDEAACGIEARRLLRGEVTNLFTVGWYHIPNLSFAISTMGMWMFGDDLFGLRMASVIQGTLSVLLIYLVARRLFSIRVALVAAFLLTVSHWHIHFSRAGISYMQALFATLLVLHFLLRGLERLRRIDFILAGFAVGLCIEVYYAARLAPFLAALYVLYRSVTERSFLRRQWRGFVIMAFGAVLFLAPLSVVYGTHPDTLMTRTEGVFILGKSNLEHAYSALRVDDMAGVLYIQAINTLTAFNYRGESSQQHMHRAPLIDFWTSALLVLGVAAAALRVLRHPYFLIDAWFWATLVFGSILTVDAMFSPRVIGLVPVLCVFPALWIDLGWRAAERIGKRAGTIAFGALVVVFLGLALVDNYQTYFEDHIVVQQPAGFNTTIARFVQDNNDRYRVYLAGRPDTSLRYDTQKFLIPDVDGVDVRDSPLPLPLDRVPATKGVAFLVSDGLPDTQSRMDALRSTYPNGVETLHKTVRGYPLFYSYVVEHDALLAAKPEALVDQAPIPAKLVGELSSTPGAEPPLPAEKSAARVLKMGGAEPFQEPREVVVDAKGEIFVLDRLEARVYRFNAEGQFLDTISEPGEGAGRLKDPRGIALEPSGNLLVLDAHGNVVSRFAPDGKFLGTIPLPGGYMPSGLAVDAVGSILVADTGLSRVLKITLPDRLEIFGLEGQPYERLDQPTDVAGGPDGEIYVADSGKQRIVVFGPDLKYRRDWPVAREGTLFGAHLDADATGVFVSDAEGRRLTHYDRNGRKLADMGVGDLERPVGVALHGGHVWVADAGTRTVHKYPLP